MGSSLVVTAAASAAAFYYPAAFSPASYPSAELLPGCIYQTDKCNNYPAKDLIRLIALSGYACSQQKFNAVSSLSPSFGRLACITLLCGPALQHFHFFFNASSKSAFFCLKIIPGLKVKPEALRKAEIARKAECRVSCDRPFPVHYFVNATSRHIDVFGKPVLGHVQGFQEFLT
jgi:hypothetical protein